MLARVALILSVGESSLTEYNEIYALIFTFLLVIFVLFKLVTFRVNATGPAFLPLRVGCSAIVLQF